MGRPSPNKGNHYQRIPLYGRDNPFYGRRHTPESIELIKKARAKQAPLSKETCARIGAAVRESNLMRKKFSLELHLPYRSREITFLVARARKG